MHGIHGFSRNYTAIIGGGFSQKTAKNKASTTDTAKPPVKTQEDSKANAAPSRSVEECRFSNLSGCPYWTVPFLFVPIAAWNALPTRPTGNVVEHLDH
jgi:hypothetical protein